jgi:hypothetical protein
VYAKLGIEDAYSYHYRSLPHAADVVAASQDR